MRCKSKSLKHTLISTVALAFTLGATLASAEGVLNVFNWAEYIAETTIADFEKEFNIKVTYENYQTLETADAKLLAGNSGYDVVCHAGAAMGHAKISAAVAIGVVPVRLLVTVS